MAQGAVKMPRLFADGMVLQRGKPIAVWGWGDAGQEIRVALLTDAIVQKKKSKVYGEATTKVNSDGRWELTLPAQKAMGPLQLRVTETASGEELCVKDVWVGDVWLCSGQSNIDTDVERVYPQ